MSGIFSTLKVAFLYQKSVYKINQWSVRKIKRARDAWKLTMTNFVCARLLFLSLCWPVPSTSTISNIKYLVYMFTSLCTYLHVYSQQLFGSYLRFFTINVHLDMLSTQ